MPAGGELEIRYRVDEAQIAEAGLKAGERYRAGLTDRCLGTWWWAFGSLEEFGDVRFRQWRQEGEREGVDDVGRFLMGEVYDDLALVIEKGTVEFEIGPGAE